jgi:hypothetical protein
MARWRRAPLVLALLLLLAQCGVPPASAKGAKGGKGGGTKSGGSKGSAGKGDVGGGSSSSKGGANNVLDTSLGGGSQEDSSNKYAEIHLAVTRGNVAKLRGLLGAGVDVDLRTEEGFTTLHIAVARSQVGGCGWV